MEILTYLLTQGILSCSYFKNLQKFHSRHLVIGYLVSGTVATRSSAIAEGPRDALCQLKSCQLPHNSAETTCTTSPEQIEVMKLEG